MTARPAESDSVGRGFGSYWDPCHERTCGEFVLPWPESIGELVRVSTEGNWPEVQGITSGKSAWVGGLSDLISNTSTGDEAGPRPFSLLDGRHAEEALEFPA